MFQLQTPRISMFQTPATRFNIDPRPCFSCSNCLLVPTFLNYFLDRSFNSSRGNNQHFNEHCQSKAMALSGLHSGYSNLCSDTSCQTRAYITQRIYTWRLRWKQQRIIHKDRQMEKQQDYLVRNNGIDKTITGEQKSLFIT